MIQYFYLISGKLHLMFNTHHVSEVAHKCNHTCLKIAHWRTKYYEKRELISVLSFNRQHLKNQ